MCITPESTCRVLIFPQLSELLPFTLILPVTNSSSPLIDEGRWFDPRIPRLYVEVSLVLHTVIASLYTFTTRKGKSSTENTEMLQVVYNQMNDFYNTAN